jgi:putative peptidoglycan lipid II flippase
MLVKDQIVAAQFGTSDALDAYLIAFMLPSLIIGVIGGSINAALVPTYIRECEHEGQKAAQRLVWSFAVWSSVGLTVASALLAISASYTLSALAPGFGPEKLALTRSLFFILLPTLVIYGLYALWAATINAGERFALTAATPMVTPILTSILVLATGQVWGVYSLAIGVVCGVMLEVSLIAWAMRRRGISLVPRWFGIDPATRQVISQFVPASAAALLFTCTTAVDQSMATMLGPGSVSALTYGNKIVTGILAIATIALSNTILPYFSRMMALGDWSGVRHTFRTYAGLVLIVSVPLTLGLIYFSEPLVRILFERGAFTAADTHQVAQIQALYLLQVPFFVLNILVVRLISSLRANHTLVWGSVGALILDIVLNYILGYWLGVAGIALATSIVYVLILLANTFFVLIHFRRASATNERR